MDDEGPRSLFAVVHHFVMDPPYYSLLQLDHECTPEEIKKMTKAEQKIRKTKVDEKVRFNLPEEPKELKSLTWLFSPLKSSTEDLYMVPNWTFEAQAPVKPLHGCKYNLTTGIFGPINLPDSYAAHGYVVNLGPHIYFISHDWDFQCYDPEENSWKALERFPEFAAYKARIVATAVWVDTILLNVNVLSWDSYRFWAYDVSRDKWYPVELEDNLCKRIVGEAVLLGDTIYALTEWKLLALSIKKEEIDDHLVFKCSLLWDIIVKPILSKGEGSEKSRHLVHMGKDMFCVVQSAGLYGNDCQPIQLTYIKINNRDNSAIVMDECFHQVKIEHNEYFMEYFRVKLCFSLPKCVTTALKEGKSFKLDPYGEDYEEGRTLLKDRLRATSQLGKRPSLGKINHELLGSSMYVIKLPPDATVRQLKKSLTKFGPIKSDGIRFGKDEEGERFAIVEFESRSSKQCAVEASTIIIGGCLAEMADRRLMDFTPAYRNGQIVGWTNSGYCSVAEAFGRSSSGYYDLTEDYGSSSWGNSSGYCDEPEAFGRSSSGYCDEPEVFGRSSSGAVGSSSFGRNKVKKHGKGSRSKMTAVDTVEERGVYQPRPPKGVR